MTHFRRMDPQPKRTAKTQRAGGNWPKKHECYWIGRALRSAPDDMPTAEPWQDRDGEWYWRRNLTG